jgi:hypothetical protein
MRLQRCIFNDHSVELVCHNVFCYCTSCMVIMQRSCVCLLFVKPFFCCYLFTLLTYLPGSIIGFGASHIHIHTQHTLHPHTHTHAHSNATHILHTHSNRHSYYTHVQHIVWLRQIPQTHTHTYIHVYTHIHIHTYTHTLHPYTHTRTFKCNTYYAYYTTKSHTHMLHTRATHSMAAPDTAHTNTHMYTHIHIYTYSHTPYTHTHTRTHKCNTHYT